MAAIADADVDARIARLEAQVREQGELLSQWDQNGLRRLGTSKLYPKSSDVSDGNANAGNTEQAARSNHGHGNSSDDLTNYLYIPGRSGGQVAYGGAATGNALTLHSNTLLDGLINVGPVVVNEATPPGANGLFNVLSAVLSNSGIVALNIQNTSADAADVRTQLRALNDAGLGASFIAVGTNGTLSLYGHALAGMAGMSGNATNGVFMGSQGGKCIIGSQNLSRHLMPVSFTLTTIAQTVVTIPLPTTLQAGSCFVVYSMRSKNASHVHVRTGYVAFDGYNVGGAITTNATTTSLLSNGDNLGAFSTNITFTAATTGTSAFLQAAYTDVVGTATSVILRYEVFNNSEVSATAP